jgi:hypothetical protein
MKTLNTDEAIKWSKAHGIALDEQRRPARDVPSEFHKARFKIPKEANRHLWFCRLVEHSLRPWTRCLFWVTEWGIWESSENWHLYYRLRQSYKNFQLLEDAPAHLFLKHETNDLVSFLQIGLSAGWDISLLSHDGYSHVFISHDEWVEFLMKDQIRLGNIGAELERIVTQI